MTASPDGWTGPPPELSDDHWLVLGIEPGATAPEIKHAFRQQARRWHPDLNRSDPVAEERFKRINEAYAVLSDPVRRRAWEQGSGDHDSDDLSGFPHFGDYLDHLFGRRSRRSTRDQPEPPPPEPEAAEPPPPPSSAPAPAAPSASVTASPPPPPPVPAVESCETVVELTPDQALEGALVPIVLPDGTEVEVWTPPHAGDGWRLRLAAVAPGGGDHFLHLRVRTTNGLRIDGLRVLYRLNLSPAQAVLGTQAVVPTLAGPVRLQVPPCSSSGRLLRLRGRGVSTEEHCGDQIVELRIVVPESPDEEMRDLYRQLRDVEAGS